jgi:subtilisin-like proprotein convertase family protein
MGARKSREPNRFSSEAGEVTRVCLPAVVLVAACAVGETGDGGSFASGWTSAAEPDAESGGDEPAAESSSSDGDDAVGSESGGNADSSDTTSSEASSSDEGESTGVGDGGLGPACAGVGEVSMQGQGGAVAASQNCPHTDFVIQVVGADVAVADVAVSIDAIAANTSQNRIWLVSPAQTQVLLFDHRGSFLTDDFVGTIFDDQAAMSVVGAAGPFHGCFAPEQSLATFVGEAANGPWTLRVETCLYETSVTAWGLHLEL